VTSDPRLRQALQELADAARRELARHPQGHLVGGSKGELELTVSVPVGPPAPLPDDAVERVERELAEEVDALLRHRAAFRPGRIFCLRCGSADCDHAAPPDARHVFAGYGPSGLPRFLDFGQWLLERRHPEIDRLFATPPTLLTDVASGRELTAELLPAFRDAGDRVRIHGQVTAGWFRVPRAAGPLGLLALSFQVLSAPDRRRRHRGRRRLALNVLGAGPDGEPLEEVYPRIERRPWSSSVRWGQSVLDSIELSQGRKSATPELLSRRIEGVLTSIARRLEQGRRARDRRTDHAEKRHEEGRRPTRMAVRDLARAGVEGFLVDERSGTVVVLGERGRTHVWTPEGRLVTSIRYSQESIERKKRQEIWRPAGAEEIAELRRRVGIGG
jgi:hypothetical protein